MIQRLTQWLFPKRQKPTQEARVNLYVAIPATEYASLLRAAEELRKLKARWPTTQAGAEA